MWDLPGPGLEPASTALAGGFLTTVPPGKPCFYFYRNFLKSFSTLFCHIFKLDFRMVDLFVTAFSANLICSRELVGLGAELGK